MCTVSESVCFLIMLMLSVKDIMVRKVSIYILAAAGAASVIYHIVKKDMNGWMIFGGIIIGIMFVLISRITKEGIGYGDSIGILILGSFLGLWGILIVLSIAFFLLLCVLIPILIRKRMSRKCVIPFYPFLTGGYVCLLLMGGVH